MHAYAERIETDIEYSTKNSLFGSLKVTRALPLANTFTSLTSDPPDLDLLLKYTLIKSSVHFSSFILSTMTLVTGCKHATLSINFVLRTKGLFVSHRD